MGGSKAAWAAEQIGAELSLSSLPDVVKLLLWAIGGTIRTTQSIRKCQSKHTVDRLNPQPT